MNYNTIELNTARNCLRLLIKIFDISELYIPFYICPTVWQAVQKENCKINFYHIDKNFLPTEFLPEKSFILYPNYFGICDNNVKNLCLKYPNIIIDNAQSYFSTPCGFASFNSYRKFLPLSCGAKLFLKSTVPQIYEKDNTINKQILTYKDLEKNETFLNTQDIKLISNSILENYTKINHDKIKTSRMKQFKNLHNLYSKQNRLNINPDEIKSPFCYPCLTKDGELGYELEKQGLKITRYWTPQKENSQENDFYKNLVCIPIE